LEEAKTRCKKSRRAYGPTRLGADEQDKDAKRTNRVMQAILEMKKLDIKRLRQAYEQE
jgi:hypothetical protein